MPPSDPSLAISAGGIVRAAREAMVGCDEEQRIVLFNPAAERMFGRAARDVVGLPLETLLPERFRGRHADFARAFMASGIAERAMDERLPVTGLRADGTEFPMGAMLSRAVVAGPQGPRALFVALITDLSEQQALSADLARAQARVRSLIELAPVPSWIVEQHRVVLANRACCQLFGLNAEALTGRLVGSLFDAASATLLERSTRHALQEPRHIVDVELKIVRGDGEVREVQLAVGSLPDHGSSTMQMALIDITQQRAAARALEASRRELRELAARAVRAREEERQHIARELHDELGQQLTALKLALLACGDPATRAAALGIELTRMVENAIAAVRRIAADLRPAMLDDLGLFPAIDWLARNAAQQLGIAVEVALDEEEPPLGTEARTALFRIVQESLTNVARHAHARHLHVAAHRAGEELVVTVQDDGVGFPDGAAINGSFGLLGMRERALMVGGRVEIGNAAGGGASVVSAVPLLSDRMQR
ncbi:PAS domain S-box protein [Aquabacterium sp.]|uniref:PAS domain-containing sensor histidine kinase n=1 Tax=Aquabacterium sp. TaxID=1872578 RepID=UPI0037843C96